MEEKEENKENQDNQLSGIGGVPGDDDSDAWMVSYADLMTLIACFFILMMAFAKYDPVGFTKKSKIVAQHFNKDKFKTAQLELETIRDEVARHPELKNKAKISVKQGELLVTFSSSVLFERGSYKLGDDAIIALDSLVDLIKSKDPNYRILAEGHTDSTTEESNQLDSNWALSAARAASVIERFEYYGFDPEKLVAIGMGGTKNLAPSTNSKGEPIPSNIAMNRRVVVKVLEPVNKDKEMKLGFGVYFKDATEEPSSTP